MSIDGCNRSFDELACDILPRYMEALSEQMANPIPLSNFAEMGIGPVSLYRRFGFNDDPCGCYVIIDNDRPIYVGISKHLMQRFIDHVRGSDHLVATLAYRMAATRHPHGKTAALAMKDPDFKAIFDEYRGYITSLCVSFIEIANPLELYLFEAYCAMELDTGFDAGGWNTFVTH